MRLTDADPFMNRDYRWLQVRNLFYNSSFNCTCSCITNLIKHLELGIIKIKIMSLVRIILKCMAFREQYVVNKDANPTVVSICSYHS
jgi:hypothetical protein